MGHTVYDKEHIDIQNTSLIFQNTSFRKYRHILNTLVKELESYHGQIIWKSTTAVHQQNFEIMGAFRRYLTSQVPRQARLCLAFLYSSIAIIYTINSVRFREN